MSIGQKRLGLDLRTDSCLCAMGGTVDVLTKGCIKPRYLANYYVGFYLYDITFVIKTGP